MKFVIQLETVNIIAAKEVLRWPSTASSTALRAELGTCPLKTNRDAAKLKREYKVREHAKKRGGQP